MSMRHITSSGYALIGFAFVVFISLSPWAIFGKDDALASFEPGTPYQEGIHYVVLDEPFDLPANHVREWMWWGCPHCRNFEPIVREWLANREQETLFEQKSLPRNSTMITHAAMFYTLERMGVLDQLHPVFFEMVQKNGFSKQSIDAALVGHGVSPEDFWNQLESGGEALVLSAIEDAARSGVGVVPTLVVGGKYRVVGPSVKTFQEMLQIADFLIDKGMQERSDAFNSERL